MQAGEYIALFAGILVGLRFEANNDTFSVVLSAGSRLRRMYLSTVIWCQLRGFPASFVVDILRFFVPNFTDRPMVISKANGSRLTSADAASIIQMFG